jgi:nicotinate-nucleotide adenylyltransferase
MSGHMRLGLLGGTFDPIHCGHLDAARAAQRELSLDRVLVIPASVPPHRRRPPVASAFHRFAMAGIAVLGEEGFAVSDLELARPGLSFSAETIRHLRDHGWAASQLFFITGVDAFAEIDTWHAFPSFLDDSHFVVVARPGHSRDRLRVRLSHLVPRFAETGAADLATRLEGPGTLILFLDSATTDVSSTDIRRRAGAGAPLEGLVPDLVARYIRLHGLYQNVHAAPRLHGHV